MAGSRATIRSRQPDPRAATLTAQARALGLDGVEAIEVADVVFFARDLDSAARATLEPVLADPLLQSLSWDDPVGGLETALHPGVTDAVAGAVRDAAAIVGVDIGDAATGTHFAVSGTLDSAATALLARRLLANDVVERWAPAPIEPAFVETTAAGTESAGIVTITTLDADGLAALNAKRGLALDPAELEAIVAHYRAAGREPTEVELEMLAQTWSEHCAHKTFRATITADDGTSVAPLLRQLRDATERIAAPFVRSAFVGNAGIVSFAEGTTLAVKAETHNHPSAVEPFGGANTGVGGVIRDVMGTSHRPIAVTDILCFGPADLPTGELPDGVLHPRLIAAGVVAGVADYGNKIGLPTVAGAVLYDAAYTANPLVYAGCIGVAPDRPPVPGAGPGDLVVVLGGRTGRDGLRGATFSSATMDATTGDVAGASVQIGDPITEQLLINALDECWGLYTDITDCGAGGLSSAVGEMAEHVGADVDVLLAPLKYPGLAAWEIWLSEAQERMVVAVPPEHRDALVERCARHGVEATVLGTFTGDGVLRVRAGDELVAELSTAFLHDGRPARAMRAVLPSPNRGAPPTPAAVDPVPALLALLAHPNIASKVDVVRRYDHEILGATVVRPLLGLDGRGHADGVVLAAPQDTHGIAVGIGVNPWFGLHDPERMAHAAVDEAMRNVVAVGGDPERTVLLDNFSWGDPRRPETLGELMAAVRGCCDASVAFGAPFVSGKDSLNNEYLGSDGRRHAIPPTLVITAMAHVPDAGAVVTPELIRPGDALVLVGRTATELAGSHLALLGLVDGAAVVPAPDPDAPARYRRLHEALRSGRIVACHDVSEGGVAVAVAEMAIAGDLGAALDLPAAGTGLDDTTLLFAESTGRFVCELAPDDVAWLSETLGEPVAVLGTVTAERTLTVTTSQGTRAVAVDHLVATFTGATS
ncbi:MAG: phosphoribosylformylglycinamidine synthase subunit PurL [Ilumatobacteraceae bacterium]